jgi:hypothetical protein
MMKLSRIYLFAALFLTAFVASAAKNPGPPVITKLGTVGVDLVETTPIVFGGTLYRLQWEQRTGKRFPPATGYFDFVNVSAGTHTAAFAAGWQFGSAYVENGTVYVTGANSSRNIVKMWTSRDLETWTESTALNLPSSYTIFNTSICKAGDKYVMAYEIGTPASEAGRPFTARFATSTDLKTWTVTSTDCVYAKDRYTAPHCLRWLNGYYYLFYLEDFTKSNKGYQTYVVRSKDLIAWESSPHNPVLSASADDRKIASGTSFTAAEKNRIATAGDINNSDIDFCQYDGRLVIYYSWGNQKGIEHLAAAVYNGTEAEFLEAWFTAPKPPYAALAFVGAGAIGLAASALRKRKEQ